jgi:hypothetical protein
MQKGCVVLAKELEQETAQSRRSRVIEAHVIVIDR